MLLQTIQPIVQKETIQPSVVHTTVPIHEVHHNEAKHHSASALPAVSMADFKKQGGSLTGREERYDGFEGEPRAVGSALGGSGTGTSTTGPHSSKFENKVDPRVDSDRDGSRNMGATQTGSGSGYDNTGSGYGNTGSNRTGTSTGSGYGNTGSNYGSNTDIAGTTGKKPSLMDRLNPMKDTDGDGKKGLMD